MNRLRIFFLSTALILTYSLTLKVVQCHVSLTFPPARFIQLDFLDNIRTARPCGGMFKNRSTVLNSGQTYEIKWKLRYPHRGGFQLELLDSFDRRIKYLTPRETFVGADDVYSQSYTVQLNPDTTCRGCAIRLVRQALDWGRNYIFQSCADVDIVPPTEFEEGCLGRGSREENGQCICESGYTGPRCEVAEDGVSRNFLCQSDADCNLQGDCVSVDYQDENHRECFCRSGFFGPKCERFSNITHRGQFISNLARYRKFSSQRGVDFYYRPVSQGYEVEGVIVGESLSYLAIGWRPYDETGDCRLFPVVARPPIEELHPMDCMDMIIGRVSPNQGYNIGDYYTRDRSTPLPDAYYGGHDDLTAALGWEEDGKTFIMFRRSAGRNGHSDNAFDGHLTFIWAHGQEDIIRAPFFQRDELKYHGNNRGSSEIVAIDFNSALSKRCRYSTLIVAMMISYIRRYMSR